MDIQLTKSDSQVLTIQAKPEPLLVVFIAVWLTFFGGIPLLMLPLLGLSLLYDTGTKTLSCQRSNNRVTCQQKEEKFLGLSQPTVIELPPIKQAKLSSFKTPKSQRVNWLTLVTQDNKEIPAFPTEWEPRGLTGDTQTIQTWVNQINTFLTSNQSSLVLTYGISQQWQGLLVLVFISAFPGIGLTVIFLTFQGHTLRLDRANQVILYRHRTLLGTKVNTYDLRAVQGLEIREQRGSKGSRYYQLQWLTNGTVRLPRLNTSRLESLQSTSQQIGEFLGIRVSHY